MQLDETQDNKIIPAIIISIIIVVFALALVLLIVLQKNQLAIPVDEVEQLVKTLPIMRQGNMSLQTVSQNLNVGDEFTVQINLDTQSSDIVLSSAVIEYNSEYLELVEDSLPANTENSVLKMSVINQLVDNKIQVINGAPGDTDFLDNDDGFNGAGELASLRFKAKKAGQTKIFFSELCNDNICEDSGMILDDGKGTNMEVGLENLDLEIEE